MGQYFKVVNPNRKQYVDAGKFGENEKCSGLLRGWHGLAVGYLISTGLRCENPLVGSWSGDPVIAAGEYADPDLNGIKTGSRRDPRRNLYQLAEEKFEDVSYKAIVMLCEFHESIIDEFVSRAKCDPNFCLDLVLAIDQVGYKPLEQELLKGLGNNLRNLRDHLRRGSNYKEHKVNLRKFRAGNDERHL